VPGRDDMAQPHIEVGLGGNMLVRVCTPRGYDYVQESLLKHFVETGYVLALAEDIEETKAKARKKFQAIFEKYFRKGREVQ